MGTLTRSELVTELSSFFADRTDISTDRLISWLNLAQTRIARTAVFKELLFTSFDTTSNTGDKDVDKFMSMPANTRKVLNIRLIDGSHSKKLIGYSYEAFDKMVPYPQKFTTGRPSIYTFWNNQVEFWKIPDATYRIEVRRVAWPTRFNSTDDVASDLDEKDDALLMLAASWGYASLRNMKDANTFWAIYKNMMQEIIAENNEEPYIDTDSINPNNSNNPLSSKPWANPFIRSIEDGLD